MPINDNAALMTHQLDMVNIDTIVAGFCTRIDKCETFPALGKVVHDIQQHPHSNKFFNKFEELRKTSKNPPPHTDQDQLKTIINQYSQVLSYTFMVREVTQYDDRKLLESLRQQEKVHPYKEAQTAMRVARHSNTVHNSLCYAAFNKADQPVAVTYTLLSHDNITGAKIWEKIHGQSTPIFDPTCARSFSVSRLQDAPRGLPIGKALLAMQAIQLQQRYPTLTEFVTFSPAINTKITFQAMLQNKPLPHFSQGEHEQFAQIAQKYDIHNEQALDIMLSQLIINMEKNPHNYEAEDKQFITNMVRSIMLNWLIDGRKNQNDFSVSNFHRLQRGATLHNIWAFFDAQGKLQVFAGWRVSCSLFENRSNSEQQQAGKFVISCQDQQLINAIASQLENSDAVVFQDKQMANKHACIPS